MLAFLVDQVQEICCARFKAARKTRRSKTSLWARMQALFTGYYINSWQDFFDALIYGHIAPALQPDTS